MKKMIGKIISFCFFLWIHNIDAASFYGSSYISMQLQEARSTTDLSFRFRTARQDTLIFLAAGRTDYCLVVLQASMLKVRINLGAGEAEVATPNGLRLNDLGWHEVRIHRKDADFTLTVDGLHSTKLRLPGRFYELNIHYGLFVGGLGDFREIFLGLWDNFRGCIQDLQYNGLDVFSKAKDKNIQVESVTWDCSSEFDATSHQDTSFMEKDSYVTFGTSFSKSGSSVRFGIKTQTREGVILYNTGPPAKPDFLAVELVEGHVRVSMDNGAGVIDLFSNTAVNDGLWHQAELELNANSVDIVIDGSSSGVRSGGGVGPAKYFELSTQIYLGGIERARQNRAFNQGIRTANASLQGCIRRLDVDGRILGFAEAKVTRHVTADCNWEYSCVQNPCIDGAQCVQDGSTSFRCDCHHPPCTKPEFLTTNYRLATKTGSTTGNASDAQLDVLNLAPLQVTEGGSMTLTSRHLEIVLDYEKFGIRESGILFHVVRPPQYGRLFSSLWRRTDEATFTLLDVHSDRIRYVHDGSETTRDSALLELELAPRAGFLLPAYLQKRQRFVLHVTINPVNDPPELSLPPGKVLRLVKNTRKALTADLLTAVDPDNQPTDLIYSVLNSKSDTDIEGFVENVHQQGVAITTFTQEDVNQGKVWFVHRGSPSGRLALRVSDGVESGPTAVLRISAYDLQLFLVNNTGLLVPINGSSSLTISNLTFATNAYDQELEIRYDIIRVPQFGAVQKWKGVGGVGSSTSPAKWQTINWFTSNQLQKDRIRYVHQNGGSPTQDDFKLSVSVPEADFRSPTTYDVRVEFLSAVLKAEHNHAVSMKAITASTIGANVLKYVTDPYQTSDEEILFSVTQAPLYGTLWVVAKDAAGKKQQLLKGSTFTQSVITANRLEYRLNRPTLSLLQDRVQFQVSTAFLTLADQKVVINFTPFNYANKSAQDLSVNEGESATIKMNHLSVFLAPTHSINYTVTKAPRNGYLNLLDATKRQVFKRNITSFTSNEVTDERVVYTHDDTENTSDFFQFLASPREIVEPDDDFQFLAIVAITVRMKNDNAPIRVSDKILHVVTNEERILSSTILKYSDPDVNTRPEEIVYTRRTIPNGALYHVDRRDVQVYQFTQADLDQERIVFKHHGSAYGKIALWITDGQFHSTGILEVQASEAFLERINSSHLVVRRGDVAVLTTSNVGFASNMDFSAEELSFDVLEEAQYGSLEITGSKTDSFRQSDLLTGAVSYANNNNQLGFKDRIKVRAKLRHITNLDLIVEVRIYPDSYWQPLKIVQNKVVVVEESTSVTIDQNSLKVFHANIVPTDIVYIVHQPPNHGYLEVDQDEEYDNEDATTKSLPPEVNVFDQNTINENRLHYIQSGANQTSDFFVFDVTNGIVTLANVSFQFTIVPKSIYLETKTIKVLEGGDVALSSTDIKIMTQYYVDKIEEFIVTRKPNRGTLQLKTDPEFPVNRFTYQQLLDKQIIYWHDSSEDTEDTMEIVAVAANKESVPATILFQVRPVDDERPTIANNTGLLVWQGSTTLLQTSNLGATDVDTLPHLINFALAPSRCGYMATAGNFSMVTMFTQQQIQDQQIVFVHQGENNCSIDFNVTDGQSAAVNDKLLIMCRKMQLLLIRNIRLHVFPMMQQSITSSHLLAITSDLQSQHVARYQITQAPRLGRLLLEQEDGSTKAVTAFTQRDLNQSLLIYEHTEPFADLSVNDSFLFDVNTDLSSPLEQQQFNIEISVTTMAEGGLDRFLGLANLETEEGGTVIVGERNLNVSGIVHFINSYRGTLNLDPPKLRLVLTGAPVHGFMSSKGVRIQSGSDIDINDIATGSLLYQHDHSDTVQDALGLSIFLKRDESSERRPDILLYNGTLRVHILPVNDQAFALITKAPAMQVVQRQSRIITSDILLTKDADTSAKDLIYEIIQAPSHGKLSFVDNTTTSVVRFSQEDVNQKRVIYLHDGTMESTSFYFRVSDGQFKPVSGVFSIHFIPLTLRLVNNSVINIQQGHTTVVIKNTSMASDSNGQRRHIFYNITQEPQYGRLYVNDVPVTTFGQSNIDKEELLYVQFNMSASSDTFQVTIWNLEIVLGKQVFNVSVTPLVSQQRVRAVMGEKTPITSAMLDANRLAVLTNSNPVFSVLRKPRYGKIRKIIPSSNRVKRQAKEKDTSTFTHEDIQNEFIFYVLRKSDLNESTFDSCEYLLTAPNVQPAVGQLDFMILPTASLVAASKSSIDATANQTNGTTNINRKGMTNDGQPLPDIISENTLTGLGISSDVVLIVGIVCAVLVLGLLVLVVVRCHAKQQLRKSAKKQESPNRAPTGDMQLYRLSGTMKSVSKKSNNDFDDAYRVPRKMTGRDLESELDSDPELPPSPRLEHFDPPLSPRPQRSKRIASPNSCSSTINSLHGRARGSWGHDSTRGTPPSVPQCKIIPLNPLLSGSESENSELVNVRYPYGIADDSLEEWAMLEPDVRFTPLKTNPMLRKNQYWV